MKHLRHEFWWWAEKQAGNLWHLACKDGVSCWMDGPAAFLTRRRYAAQRALWPKLHGRA